MLQVIFRATTDHWVTGDIAVDLIEITKGACEGL